MVSSGIRHLSSSTLGAQLFLEPYIVPHRRQILSQLQNCWVGLGTYLGENTISFIHEV